ncbi:hypothetical protein SZN_17282 [Streptomyces zinciresistens K42]|uniref:Uncharacterized protein n=1 Tax=Streptomyces zinciresistens K42 TaxID=700597 RepID=G2GD79_9ACTN|nr:hypothetical protein [Streptomyces zinciresistens]EGX58540.1 hypothetical protein SZN_17282 [Streptomyces zinciresistens K42]
MAYDGDAGLRDRLRLGDDWPRRRWSSTWQVGADEVCWPVRERIDENRIRAARPVREPSHAVPSDVDGPPGDVDGPPAEFASDAPCVRRKVYRPGIIVVGHQTIHVGLQWHAKTVTVLVADEWFRVVHDGREITTVRRRRTGVDKIHGAPD